jgi:hypothetical protein
MRGKTMLRGNSPSRNQKDIEAAGLSFILGAKIPSEPYVVARWRREHPGEQIGNGQVFTQPWPAITSSPPLTRYPTTSDRPSKPSTAPAEIRPASLTGNLRLLTGPGRAGAGLLAGGGLSTTGGARS